MGLLDSFRPAPIIDKSLLPAPGQKSSFRLMIDTKKSKVHILEEKFTHHEYAMGLLKCREKDLPKIARHLVGCHITLEEKNGIYEAGVVIGFSTIDDFGVTHTTQTMRKATDIVHTYLDKKLDIVITRERINTKCVRDINPTYISSS